MLNILISMVVTIVATAVSMNWFLLPLTFALIIGLRLVVLYFEFREMRRKSQGNTLDEKDIANRFKNEAD
ncbi:MAG: hypothetical protein ACI358_01605 [Candidatus Limimorpha sp.]